MIQIAFWLENEKMDENGMFSYLPMGLQVKDSLVQAYGVGQVSLPLVLPPSRSSVEWPSHHLSQQLSQVALVAFMFWFVRHDWSFNPNELRQTCLPTSNSSLKQGLVQESLRDIVTVCDSMWQYSDGVAGQVSLSIMPSSVMRIERWLLRRPRCERHWVPIHFHNRIPHDRFYWASTNFLSWVVFWTCVSRECGVLCQRDEFKSTLCASCCVCSRF